MNISKSWGGESLNPDDVASPCGAIGINFSYFSKNLFQ